MMLRRGLVVLALVLSAVPAWGQVSYDGRKQLLSITYHGAPLREVLGEISRKTGIAIYIDPGVEKTVYIDRSKVPVDEALNEIVKPLNCMLIFKGNIVQAVQIYQQTPADAMQKIDAGRSAPARPAAPPAAAAPAVTPPAPPAAAPLVVEPRPPSADVQQRLNRNQQRSEERRKRHREEDKSE